MKPGRGRAAAARAAGAALAGSRRGALTAASALLLSVGGCLMGGGEVTKRGSEVENEVYGILVDASGNAGRGAMVRAYPSAGFALPMGSGGAAGGAVDSAVADTAGRYAFADLPAGDYNFIAEHSRASLVAFIPRVALAQGYVKRDLGRDTLRAPGAIRGRITLGGAGKEGAMAYLPGTTYLAFSDANGEFLVTGVPQGTFAVQYLVAGLNADPDTGVVVVSGRETLLPGKELGFDTALAPPAPSRVQVAFDTLNGAVRVQWNAIRVSDLLGYLVYRDTGTLSSPELRTPTIVTDTVFLDDVVALAALDPPPIVTYRVVSVDRGKNASARFSPPAQTLLAPLRSLALELALRQLDGPANRASIGDTVRLEVSYRNPGRFIRKVSWWTTGSTVPARVRADSTHDGKDTLVFALPDTGRYWAAVVVTDDGGPSHTHVWNILVLLDPPIADAGADREAFPGDTVRIQGSARQEFGTIVQYAWDVGGTGRFEPAPGGQASFVAPPIPGSVLCILRVVDEDGNADLDTVTVVSARNPPIAQAAAGSEEATASDTVPVRGTFRSGNGRIVAWEWDLGGTGRFGIGPPDTFAVMPGTVSGTYPCILRVTDEKGQQDMDTAWVRIVPDPPVAVLSSIPPSIDAGGLLTLTAAGSDDRYGRIVRWEWDIGNTGRFVPASGRDTVVTAPAAGTEFACGLRVTDDDGRMDTAILRIPVLPRGAWVEAFDLGFQENPISFRAGGSGLGRVWIMGSPIEQQEWQPRLLHSRNLRDWESVPAESSWVEIGGPATILEFGGRLWFIGYNLRTRHNEFWASPDGVQWTLVSRPEAFRDRMHYTVAAFGDRLWIIGGMDGYDQQMLGETWSSADGVAWEREAALPAFGPRMQAQAAVHAGRLWIYGGKANAFAVRGVDDLWSSADGRTWTRAGATPAPTGPDYLPTSFAAHGGQLRLIRSGRWEEGTVTTAWHSPDGRAWSKDPDPPGFTPTDLQFLVVLNGRLWMLGSRNNGEFPGKIWLAP